MVFLESPRDGVRMEGGNGERVELGGMVFLTGEKKGQGMFKRRNQYVSFFLSSGIICIEFFEAIISYFDHGTLFARIYV